MARHVGDTRRREEAEAVTDHDEARGLRPARAFHDLNEVSVIEITGWRGPHAVRAHAASDCGVAIIAPRRIDGEFWTFQRQQDGVLKCHSDPIGSPSLPTVSTDPMVVLLPGDRIGSVSVRFEGLPEACAACRADAETTCANCDRHLCDEHARRGPSGDMFCSPDCTATTTEGKS
jgi:hypothetical protein